MMALKHLWIGIETIIESNGLSIPIKKSGALPDFLCDFCIEMRGAYFT